MASQKKKAAESASIPFSLTEARKVIEIHTMCSFQLNAAKAGIDPKKLVDGKGLSARERSILRLADTFKDVWHKDYHGGKMLVLQGESGVAKTALIRQVAQYGNLLKEEVEKAGKPWMEMMLQSTGGEEEETESGAFNSASQKDGGKTHSFTVPEHCFPTKAPDSISGLGFLFHDELFTKRPMQQNNLSLLISHGHKEGRWGHIIPPGWVQIGATNPPTADYHLSQHFDKRLKERCWVIDVVPTTEELLRFFSHSGLLPDTLYGFLLMNKQFLEVGSSSDGKIAPRTWDYVGHFLYQTEIMQLVSGTAVDHGLIIKMLIQELGPSIAGAYETYLTRGDDPALYPIIARELLNATDDEKKEHKKRVETWFKADSTALLAATAQDLSRWLSDPNLEFSEANVTNACDFIATIARAPELAQQVLDSTIHGRRDHLFVPKLGDTPFAEKLLDMVNRDTKERESRRSRRS